VSLKGFLKMESELVYEQMAFEIMPKFFSEEEQSVEKTASFLIQEGCDPDAALTYAVRALESWTDLWTGN
jgi:hypothetical protein